MVKTYCIQCSKKCTGDVLKVGEKYFHQSCFKCKDCCSFLDTGGFFFRNGDYYCPRDYTKRFSNKCFICSNLIESEIVSALNNHFHRNCFKCNICCKIFAPGDRVTMKSDQFICSTCLCDQETELNGSTSKDFSSYKARDISSNKDLLTDDIITDQGYISADPTSLSLPTQNEETKKIANHPNNVNQRKKSQSKLSRSLFEFGKFYRTSYLDIQESRQRERQSQSKKSGGSQFSNKFQLPLSKNRYLKTKNHDTSSVRYGIDCAIKSMFRKMSSASESDVNEKENVIHLSSYPAGEKQPDNIPVPLERDDWPAPLSTAILLREKMLRKRSFFETAASVRPNHSSGDDVVDYSQSLCQLSSDLSNKHPRNLIEFISGSPTYDSNRQLEDNVISASRSPNASIEPTSKPRYHNHKDKSKSRDSTYFDDSQRHIGYSLDFISSTTRPFMAGRVPYEIYGSKAERSPCNSYARLRPGYTHGLLEDMKHAINRESAVLNTNNSNKRCNEVGYTWTAVRTMSDTFDVQLKHIEYDSTTEGTLYDHHDDEFSTSEIDLVTGLKITKHRNWKERIKEPIITSDKSSINSKIESIETWSFWSQKPLTGIKSSIVPYYDIISKDPKIMKGLDINRLETYLSTAEFEQLFNINRTDFYRLPEWKQNDLKRRVHLF